MRKSMAVCVWLVLLVFLGVKSASAAGNAENGVVAWYKFNEGSGDVLKDYSGNGNDGKIIGNPVWVEEGKNGKSLKFDGKDGRPNLLNFDPKTIN